MLGWRGFFLRGSVKGRGMTQDLKPYWGTHKYYLTLSVLEFVALYGARIEPRRITYSGGRKENFPPAYQGWMVDDKPASTEFKDMLALAERNIINNQTAWPNSYRIPIEECDTWARSWDWGIPDERAALAKSEKPLTSNERNTLLVIIAALCDYSDIKYQERGAAGEIAKMTEEISAAISDDSIRRALAKIPEALDRRRT